jgi:cytochrome c biogenesis protein CcmG/thiol:disulfide interchange protein DsbE
MSDQATPAKRRSWLVALPLLCFVALAALFLVRLGSGDPSKIPSALIGRPAPLTVMPALEGLSRDGAQMLDNLLPGSRIVHDRATAE